ncbi:MAG: GNAT family N-acetyltransferase [Cyanobacteria bacterium P01_D01_bin.1]
MTLPQYDESTHGESAYEIRAMSRDELVQVVGWAAAEGWNPGLCDVECFYAADPNGFLIGLLDGEPIASISAVKYGTDFGFIGFYMVRPDFRGKGYGLRIWRAGLARLEARNVGLDGVIEQQSNYAKSGFAIAHRNIRYEGIGTAECDDRSRIDAASLVDLVSLPTAIVNEYDQEIFLEQRSAFLDCWIQSSDHQALGIMHNQKIAGYGVLRPCQQGYKIGPLFADSPKLAEDLFLALKEQVKAGSPFYLDVPGNNSAAVALAQKYQMTSVFETARMYNRGAPPLPLGRIYGITTFELG